jgi:hypothetical protein
MKKSLMHFASLSTLACLILLPVIRSVNGSAGNYVTPAPTLMADGNPMPSPLPPAANAGVLVADGNPMPSPLPPAANAGVLVADGNPMPNPLPSGPHFVELTASA